MRSFFALILATMLGAAAAHAQPDADSLSFIKAIYQTYNGTEGGLPHMYSRRLQALVDKDTKETPDGYVGRIDWDVFVNAQDTQLTELKIVLVSKSATTAQVRATFKNFDSPSNILFDLVRENGHWRIDEIQETLKPRWIMSKILSDAPDAFLDAKPDDAPPAPASDMRETKPADAPTAK
jgi:hypothetical protein